MIDLTEKLRTSLETIEAAAYDDLVSRFCTDFRRWGNDNTSYLYGRVARGAWCKQATHSLLRVVSRLTDKEVRREHHIDYYGEHFFLSIPALGSTSLAACDIVIDPTYQQFIRPDIIAELELPRVFIGTRLAIFEMMHTPEFEDLDTSPGIYLADTLCDVNNTEKPFNG